MELSGKALHWPKVPFPEANLEQAVAIFVKCHRHGGHLRRPIRRWVKALKGHLDDNLIEWRVSVDMIYGLPRLRGDQMANAAAWHLGESSAHRKKLRTSLTRAYQCASEVIHGNDVAPGFTDADLSDALEACRQGILELLDEPSDA